MALYEYYPYPGTSWWDYRWMGYQVTYYPSYQCPWCGQYHVNSLCPRVKALEYYPDGMLKRVEFHDGQKIEFATDGDGQS